MCISVLDPHRFAFWIRIRIKIGTYLIFPILGHFLFTVCRVKRKISKGEGEPASGLALKLQTGSGSSINYADPKHCTYRYVLQVCVSLLAFSSLDGA
jgi:hypothetical protein